MTTRHRLAVWGDPIDHSRSPALHQAAYRALGVDWTYERRRVDDAGFADAFASLDGSWRGLSLTMPLKEAAHRASTELDRHAIATGVANTLLLGDRVRGFNTDVGGIIDAFAGAGVADARRARILGAGATAASAVVAFAEMGAVEIDVRARRPAQAAALQRIGDSLGVAVTADAFDAPAAAVDATIATLPSGTVLDEALTAPLAAAGGALLDAAYAPWPSALAATWADAPVVSGLEMLLGQALRQVRVFLHGDPLVPLPDEGTVRAAMRDALV